MIKVRSILHKKEVIEVPENHYYDVLVRSRTWELVPEEIKPCQPNLTNVLETGEEFVPLQAEVSTSVTASLVASPSEATPSEKRKPGRPKQINKE
jgi:hypothetical protein